MNIGNAIANLNSICIDNKMESILFNLTYNNMDCRIIYANQSKVILMAIRKKNVAWFIPIEEGDNISIFIPRDIFFEIIDHLDDSKDFEGKKTTEYFFRAIVNDMEIINKEQVQDIADVNNDVLNEIIGISVTEDKKYDKANGSKPYFDTWVRNSTRKVSNDNLLKTKRNFGEQVALVCEKNNISARWSSKPTENALNVFNHNKNLKSLDYTIE